MLQRLRAMLIKEFIQALRNPRMRIILFVPPVVQLLIFGYAANTDIRNISLAVYDMDNSPESRELIENFASSGYFRIFPSGGPCRRAAVVPRIPHGHRRDDV